MHPNCVYKYQITECKPSLRRKIHKNIHIYHKVQTLQDCIIIKFEVHNYLFSLFKYWPEWPPEQEIRLHASPRADLARTYVTHSWAEVTSAARIGAGMEGSSCCISWVVKMNLLLARGTNGPSSIISAASSTYNQRCGWQDFANLKNKRNSRITG